VSLQDILATPMDSVDAEQEAAQRHADSLGRRINVALRDLGLIGQDEALVTGRTELAAFVTMRPISVERADRLACDLEDLAQRAGR
jgi:hypothetical protein